MSGPRAGNVVYTAKNNIDGNHGNMKGHWDWSSQMHVGHTSSGSNKEIKILGVRHTTTHMSFHTLIIYSTNITYNVNRKQIDW